MKYLWIILSVAVFLSGAAYFSEEPQTLPLPVSRETGEESKTSEQEVVISGTTQSGTTKEESLSGVGKNGERIVVSYPGDCVTTFADGGGLDGFFRIECKERGTVTIRDIAGVSAKDFATHEAARVNNMGAVPTAAVVKEVGTSVLGTPFARIEYAIDLSGHYYIERPAAFNYGNDSAVGLLDIYYQPESFGREMVSRLKLSKDN